MDNLDTDNLIEPLAGNYRKLVIGDFDFGGKVQDLEFGFGKTEQNLSSKTVCGVEYKTIHEELSKFKVMPTEYLVILPWAPFVMVKSGPLEPRSETFLYGSQLIQFVRGSRFSVCKLFYCRPIGLNNWVLLRK